MRLTSSRFLVALALFALVVSVYVDSGYVVQMFNPFNRSLGQLSRLAALVPVVPIEAGVPFSVLASSFDSGSSIKISSSGSTEPSSVLALGVYSENPEAGVIQPLRSIDWSTGGPIVSGQSRNSSVVYLRNEGNKAVGLYLSSSGWAFRDAVGNVLGQDYRHYFYLDWNYDDSKMEAGEVRPVIFSLTVWSGLSDVSTFSFDLVVTLTS